MASSEIKKNSELAIADYQTRQRKEAVAKATEIAKAAGFSSLENLLAAQPIKKAMSANRVGQARMISANAVRGWVPRCA